jgi:hypothetical protein
MSFFSFELDSDIFELDYMITVNDHDLHQPKYLCHRTFSKNIAAGALHR